jgi:hypothetical protein
MELSIGITGHRDLVPAEQPALREQVRAFFQQMLDDFPQLHLQLLTPLAEGADSLVAEVAQEMGIPYVVVLPMFQELYETDFDNEDSLALFRKLLGGAVSVIELPPHEGIDPTYIESHGAARDQQYAQAGIFISNHCQVLLALWDGRKAKHSGGTADVLHYHLTGMLARPGDRNESPNLLAENENDLAFHIPCSRLRNDGARESEAKSQAAHWIYAHFESAPEDGMPAAYHHMLQRLVQYGHDRKRFAEAIESQSYSLLSGLEELKVPAEIEEVDRKFGAADWLAIYYRKRVSAGLLATHMLAVLMGLAFIVYSEFEGMDWLVLVFLALFFCGVGLFLWSERRQWHRKYLDYRALAEGLRVQLYWLMSGVVDTSSIEFAYDNFLQKQDVDLGWIRHVMRSVSLAQDREDRPDTSWVDWVITNWVGRPGDLDGQLAYYQYKSTIKEKAFRRTELLGNISLWLGISLAVVLYAASGRLGQNQHQVLLVLMGVLPLFAAVRSAYSHQKADKELIKQYRFMSRVFGNAHRLLKETHDIDMKRQVLRALGNAALEEHAEWILMHRERPLEHGRL